MAAPCEGRDRPECQSCLRHIDRAPELARAGKTRWVPMLGTHGCMDHKPECRAQPDQERP